MAYLSGIHSHVSERPIVLFFPADDDPAIVTLEIISFTYGDAVLIEDGGKIVRVDVAIGKREDRSSVVAWPVKRQTFDARKAL